MRIFIQYHKSSWYETYKKQKTLQMINLKGLIPLAVRTGLEPATPCVTGTYSNQLNYRTVLGSANIQAFLNDTNRECKKM